MNENLKKNELSLAAQAPADQLPAITSDTNNLMGAIIACASNPTVDADKVERLLGMYERIKANNAKAAYFAALAEMQDEFPAIIERGTIGLSSSPNANNPKYALWEDINKIIKPVMKKHGFALSFRTGISEHKITVTGILSHRDGHSEETTIHLPSDTGPGRNAVQAVGSSLSYGKRYVAIALLNITSTGDDDDGAAAAGDYLEDDELQKVYDLLDRTKADRIKFCKYLGVPDIPSIKRKDFARAIEALNLKLSDQAKK